MISSAAKRIDPKNENENEHEYEHEHEHEHENVFDEVFDVRSGLALHSRAPMGSGARRASSRAGRSGAAGGVARLAAGAAQAGGGNIFTPGAREIPNRP